MVDTIDRRYPFDHHPVSRLPPRRPPSSSYRRERERGHNRVSKPISTSNPTHPDTYHPPPSANWFKAVPSPTTQLDTNLPKNFRQPLTCFFWYQYKRCSKSSAECPYAHYDTGFYAKAPFGLVQSSGSTADSHASTPAEIERMRLEVEDKVSALAQRERDVEDREKEVEDRERAVAEKERQFARRMRGVEKALGVREKSVKRREEALRRGVGGDGDV